MNPATIRRLILKDWYLHRVPATLTVVGSVIAVGLVMLPVQGLKAAGANLAMAVLITISFYLPLTAVLEERNQRTMTFLMSLPISMSEYVASKLVANLSLYLLPWLTIVLGTLVVSVPGRAEAASGWVPVVLVGMVATFCFLVTFALVTESSGWTVGVTITLLFLFGHVLTQIVPQFPSAARVMYSIGARGPAFRVVLTVEALVIVAVLGLCFFIQSRKRDFL